MAKKRNQNIRRNVKRSKPSMQAAAAQPSAVAARLETVSLYRSRQRLRNQIEKERADRFKKFLAGTEKPTQPPSAGLALRSIALESDKPNLRILAEGDSWFEYPLPVTHGDGVIYQLEKLLGYEIANMAHHGLEVEQMLGLSIRQDIIARLTDPRVRFDALLFSGGGNDIVGDQFCIWLKDFPPVPPPDQMLDTTAVNSALAILEAEYRELLDIRNQFSPQTVILTHAYDFPPVTGKGVCGAGPWLKPSLDFAYKHLGVANPDPNDEFVVVKTILQMFGAMLKRIAADPAVDKFVVVPTQGTLTPDASDWQNEIHPSSAGFVKIAQKFQTALASVFPA
jgi:hypothetical protein